jgi:hypothetical protein
MNKSISIFASVLCVGLLVYNASASTCSRMMEGRMSETKEEQIVRSQLEAFNKKDVEGCLKYFSDDLTVTVLPDETVIASSKDEIRTHLIQQIESGDFMPATLVDISSNGPFVMTTEVKEGRGKRSTISFIYYVEDGLITKMWGAPFSEDL